MPHPMKKSGLKRVARECVNNKLQSTNLTKKYDSERCLNLTGCSIIILGGLYLLLSKMIIGFLRRLCMQKNINRCSPWSYALPHVSVLLSRPGPSLVTIRTKRARPNGRFFHLPILANAWEILTLNSFTLHSPFHK